jgi:Mor family transcriptional regulator
MLGASFTSAVYADGGNETEPDPYTGGGTNSTIPDGNTTAPDGNTTIPDGNTTLPDGNTTIPDGNTTVPDGNTTLPEPETTGSNNGTPIDPALLEIIKEQAQNTTQWINNLLSAATLSQETINSLQHAEQAMTQAQTFEGNNTRAAAQQYLRAMKHIRNALRKSLKENPDLIQPVEGNTTGTGDDFNQTVPDNLNATISAARQELVQRFQERFRNQTMEMYRNVDEMMADMGPQDYYKAQSALMKAEQKMLRIQEKIDAGAFSEAVDELENATSTLDDELGDVSDPGTAQMLRTLNKLEAKIGRMQEKADRKAALGEDTSGIEALLSQLRGNRYHTKNNYKSHGKGGNGKPDKPDKNHENNGKGNN